MVCSTIAFRNVLVLVLPELIKGDPRSPLRGWRTAANPMAVRAGRSSENNYSDDVGNVGPTLNGARTPTHLLGTAGHGGIISGADGRGDVLV